MKFVLEIDVDKEEAFVKKAMKFGTSAHIVIPGDWLGQMVEVRKVKVKKKG